MFFIVTIFSAIACSNKKQPLLSASLTAEEKADLEYFFRFLIFENYGDFVLFGSKPLCEMHLSDTESPSREAAFQKWLHALPDEERAKIEAIKKTKTEPRTELERNPYRGWQALEKVRQHLKINNFILRLVPVHIPNSDELTPGSYDLKLINIQQTALILAENYEIFKRAAGMDFQPLEAVFELQNPDSIFWKNVFAMRNHLAKGLLFGFGLKNSIFFDWEAEYTKEQLPVASEKYRQDILDYFKHTPVNVSATPTPFCQGNLSNFTIPVFGMVAGNEMKEKYTKEKAAIEKMYRGQDMVEVTLQGLAKL